MFKVALVRRDLQGAMFVQGVVTGVGSDFSRSLHTVQPCVVGVTADAAIGVHPHYRRCIAHLPLVTTRPERGHFLRRTIGISEYHIESDVGERVSVSGQLVRVKADFNRWIHVLFSQSL